MRRFPRSSVIPLFDFLACSIFSFLPKLLKFRVETARLYSLTSLICFCRLSIWHIANAKIQVTFPLQNLVFTFLCCTWIYLLQLEIEHRCGSTRIIPDLCRPFSVNPELDSSDLALASSNDSVNSDLTYWVSSSSFVSPFEELMRVYLPTSLANLTFLLRSMVLLSIFLFSGCHSVYLFS